MNLKHLSAFLKRYPKMRSCTLGQMSAFPAIWRSVLSLAKEC